MAKSDNLETLQLHLKRARTAVRSFPADADVVAHDEALGEASGAYLKELRRRKFVLEAAHLTQLESLVVAIESDAARHDLVGVLAHSTALLSAMPGDPTTGMKPPQPRPRLGKSKGMVPG